MVVLDFLKLQILHEKILNKMKDIIKTHNERMKQLDLSIVSDSLSDDDAALIIENVLDVLVEVGNGTTDEELYKAADYLFALRDKWFDKRIK